MRIFRKLLRALLATFILIIVFSIFIFTRVDRKPYKEMAYYQEMLKAVDSVGSSQITVIGDTVQVGWGKASILPPKPVPLAGYGNRRGKIMEGIKDTLWVRAFVLDNSITKAVFVAMDLLIVPPEVEIALKRSLSGSGFNPDHLYLSATHTHSSIGAWGPGFAGEAVAGEYDTLVVNLITRSAMSAIKEADATKQISKIGYAEIDAGDFVENRLVGDEGITDPWLRLLKFEKKSGEVGVLTTFSAHPTCYGHTNMHITRDYPGVLVDSLEKIKEIDFAAFTAGAVGSHRPVWAPTPEEQVAQMAIGLFNLVNSNILQIETNYMRELKAAQVVLPLRAPHVRVTENWRLRPWIFTRFFGDYTFQLSFLRIGNCLMIGTPCDFSGELMPPLMEKAREEGIDLIVTSFNGGYIGYITLDKWYDLNKYETRAMNWFGPYNGAYISEYMERMMKVM